MSTREHLSTRVRLVEASEHVRQARDRLPEDDGELRDHLDTLIADIETAKLLAETAEDDERWRVKEVNRG